jgi:hypothetical protein
MQWIDLCDQARLCRYADEICRDCHVSDLFRQSETESFFTNTAGRRGKGIPDSMRYEPHTIRGLREKLNLLWENSDLPQKDLLMKIVAAAVLKNDPLPLDYDRRLHEWNLAVGRHSAQPVALPAVDTSPASRPAGSAADAPADGEDPLTSVLVYEF